jgi:hypothetical protein
MVLMDGWVMNEDELVAAVGRMIEMIGITDQLFQCCHQSSKAANASKAQQ